MTTLLILGAAAFALVAVLTSGISHAALPWLDRWARSIAPRHRVRLWLAVAALPSLVGLLALTVSFLPAMGIGDDHCLAHGPHHPHLCPNHVGAAPGILLILIALLLVVRGVYVLTKLLRVLYLSRDTSRTLAEVSVQHDGVHVLPASEPQAFLLGTVHPRVYVSRGLLSLGHDLAAAVVAHERVHARRHDLLWRAACRVLAVGHLPATTTAIQARLVAEQEMAADEEAGDAIPGDGRLRLAEALVMVAKLARTPSPGIAFTDGDLETRVRALLAVRPQYATWPIRLLLATLLLMPALVGASHAWVHHGLETLLGALS